MVGPTGYASATLHDPANREKRSGKQNWRELHKRYNDWWLPEGGGGGGGGIHVLKELRYRSYRLMSRFDQGGLAAPVWEARGSLKGARTTQMDVKN